jgi:pimeloyl-ACP methyl ester carboxylesterase
VAGAVIAVTMMFLLRDSGSTEDSPAAGLPLVAEGYVPKLEPRDCPADLTSDPVVCRQDLVVPEDRNKPTGRQLRIPVYTYAARTQKAGVVTVTTGGFPDNLEESNVREYGELVSLGIRGAQTLTCPEVDAVHFDFSGPARSAGPELQEFFLDASEQCGQRLTGEGFDLDQYGLNDMADDVRDLAIVMGWHQINIQGADRWSRVAVLFATRYPGFVRSVVIANPLPRFAEENTLITNYNSSLQAYFAACHADAACERAFPDLEQTLLDAYERYNQNPAVVMVADPDGGPDFRVVIDGEGMVAAVMQALSNQSALGFIASTLALRDSGGLETTATYLVENARRRGYPWGMLNSTYCEDVDPLVFRSAFAAMATAYPLFLGYAHSGTLELCDHWPTNAAPALSGEARVSAVPALLLAGALSPDSGPANAQDAAKSFKNATIAVFPNLTNGVLQGGPPCVAQLRLAFLRDPKAKLDIDGCIAQVRPIAFAGTDSAGTTPSAPTPAP